MSLVLGLDTATDDTSVAVLREGEALFEESRGPVSGRPLHGPALLEMLESAVAEAGGWGEVGTIAVGTGPGSFTGLRVGIATARALARSTSARLSGVCTLDALATGVGNALANRDDRILCALDARRGQIFGAVYRGRRGGQELGMPNRVVEPFVCEPSELGRHLPSGSGKLIAVGSGALRFRADFEAAEATVPEPASPEHRVSARCTALIGGASPGTVEPIYLRAPDAERWQERSRT